MSGATCLCATDPSTRPRSHQIRGTTDATSPNSTTEGDSQDPVRTIWDQTSVTGGAVRSTDCDDSTGSSRCPPRPPPVPHLCPVLSPRPTLCCPLPCSASQNRTPRFTFLRSLKTPRPTPHPDGPSTSVSTAKAGRGVTEGFAMAPRDAAMPREPSHLDRVST